MSSSLLSVFDPGSSNLSFIPLKWLISLIGFMLIWPMWTVKSGHFTFMNFLSMGWKSQLEEQFKFYKFPLIFSLSIFITIFCINEMGMVPYLFTPTSHFSLNLCLALPLWLTGIICMLKKNWKALFSHLVPEGSPMGLAPLLVIIELVSLLIRPISLSIRLMSNIMAGHMILSLASSAVSSMSISSSFLMEMVVFGLMSFELCVGIVQAYIFSCLLVMYWSESQSSIK
uniref:ATP synthase subunit a n=1 Tax=Bothriometopus macrocnemis TaxID=475769 RepID=A8VU06_9NEOP|nr:ATP synthase F0 subunit 6 [Bothriometopus macrocnemis]ABW20539.1 ATP synthase F0 subunit 6 [Bothriometopus macrocnemis]UTT72562.1 ATP synthase F0 subunit 6 [Bothriometopus macrocnemis]